MRATFHNRGKSLIFAAALQAVSVTPLPAATLHHSHHRLTGTASQAASHRPTMHPDPGYRLLYSVEMRSQGFFDMSAALHQQDPHADLTQAPKMSLLTALKGTVELVPIGKRGDRIQILCTIKPDQLSLLQNGMEVTQPIPQLRRQLQSPILVEYNDRGQIASVRFDADIDSTAQGFARTLLAYLQVSLSDDAAQHQNWQAREAEPSGVFLTRYTRQAATATILTLSKTRCGAATTVQPAATGAIHATETVTPSGTLTVTLDTRHGLIQAVHGEESFATVLGAVPVARSRNSISLELQGRTQVTPADSRSLVRLGRIRMQQSSGLTLAQMPQITRQQEAEIQRVNLGDASVEQVLAQLAAIDRSSDSAKDARDLLPRLKAVIFLYPQICSTLQTQLLSARPDQIRIALIAEALRAAGHPAAQKALIAALQARHKEMRVVAVLIPTLAQLQTPIPQVVEMLQQTARSQGAPFTTSMAWLALGTLARTLEPQAPQRARQITLTLQHQLLRERSDRQKRTLLLALANAAQPSTLPTLLQQA